MEEAPENGKEYTHFPRANGMYEHILLLIMHLLVRLCLHLSCNSCITLPWKISPPMMWFCMVMWQVSLKHHYAIICLPVVTSQQSFIFLVTVMRTWHHINFPSYTVRQKLCYSLLYYPVFKMMVICCHCCCCGGGGGGGPVSEKVNEIVFEHREYC